MHKPLQGFFLLFAVLSLALGGCGFQLRGKAQLPPDMAVTYIRNDHPAGPPPNELTRSLRRALEANGVVVTTNPTEAKAVLAILSERVRRRTLAANRGDTFRQYTLTYTVDYTITRSDGSPLIPRDTVSFNRDVLYDESQVLGRDAGEEIVVRDMVADATRAILLRLQLTAAP